MKTVIQAFGTARNLSQEQIDMVISGMDPGSGVITFTSFLRGFARLESKTQSFPLLFHGMEYTKVPKVSEEPQVISPKQNNELSIELDQNTGRKSSGSPQLGSNGVPAHQTRVNLVDSKETKQLPTVDLANRLNSQQKQKGEQVLEHVEQQSPQMNGRSVSAISPKKEEKSNSSSSPRIPASVSGQVQGTAEFQRPTSFAYNPYDSKFTDSESSVFLNYSWRKYHLVVNPAVAMYISEHDGD